MLVDFIELMLIVRPLNDRVGRQLAIAQVFCEQTVRILAEPLQRMPVVVGGSKDPCCVRS